MISASPAQPWCRPGTWSSCQPPKAAPQHRARPPKLGADKYEDDPELEKIRKDRNYSWVDIITIYKDKLPNYEEEIKMFCEVHWHLDVEIRYILDGSGYFDVRDEGTSRSRFSWKRRHGHCSCRDFSAPPWMRTT